MASSSSPAKIPTTLTADERTPLLGAPDTAGGKALGTDAYETDSTRTLVGGESGNTSPAGPDEVAGEHDDESEDKPMPYLQVVLLCFASTVDSVSYFAIFPIIGDMLVKSAGLNVKDISLWSGVIETLFSVVQMLVMLAYGKVSDRIGRKPVLVFSLFGIVGAQILFGMSQTLWQMMLTRCLTGFFAGSSVCVRSMLSEVTTKKTQARAFSLYMFARNLGIFIGPLIGGTLANPAEHIPLLRGSAFFEKYPFSLSLFATAIFTLVAALTTLIVVKETLKSKISPCSAPVPEITTWELLKSPGVLPVIYITSHVNTIALAFTAVSSVFYYTPVSLGGFGLGPDKISIFIALAGASQAIWMLGPFTPLQKRFGTGGLLRACTYVWPFFMATYPLLNELLRHNGEVIFWIALPVGTFLGCGVAMAFACTQLAINDIAPSSNTLGTLNAVALTVSCAVRAVVPVLATAIFEWGLKGGWLDGHLFWVLLTALCLALIIAVRWLPEKAEGRPVKPDPE